jgi:hypothetical protein
MVGGNMKIGGYSLREYFRLLAPLFGLIGAVWVLRIIVAEANSPPQIIRIVSVTTATAFSIILAVIFFHARNFGGYTSVFVASLMLNIWAELLIIAAILFAMITHTNNIYTIHPSFPAEAEAATLSHIYTHLTLGIGIGTLGGAAVGFLMLWLLRILVPNKERDVINL